MIMRSSTVSSASVQIGSLCSGLICAKVVSPKSQRRNPDIIGIVEVELIMLNVLMGQRDFRDLTNK